jgi:hypothetical protein
MKHERGIGVVVLPTIIVECITGSGMTKSMAISPINFQMEAEICLLFGLYIFVL